MCSKPNLKLPLYKSIVRREGGTPSSIFSDYLSRNLLLPGSGWHQEQECCTGASVPAIPPLLSKKANCMGKRNRNTEARPL